MTQPISASSPAISSYSPEASEESSEPAPGACTEELVYVGRAGVVLAGSVAALVAAAPSVVAVLPGIAGFIAGSMLLGEAAADYLDCQDGAAAKTE